MATSTQALVLDLALAKVRGLVDSKGAIAGVPNVYVFDGIPGQSIPDNFVAVMDLAQPSSGTEDWRGLGDRSRTEEYDFAVSIHCFVGGDSSDPTEVSNAQALARQNAAAIEAAIEAAFVADANLAVQNGGVIPIVWCLLAGVSLSQTGPDDMEEMGRFAHFDLRFHVHNVIYG